MKRFLVTALLLAVTLGLGGCGYNTMQTGDQQIKAAWAEVVNQYQRRADLVPNLVNTVKGAPRGIGVMYWQPEWEAWNKDGSPGPVVSVMDQLQALAGSPDSHAPVQVRP